MRRSHRPEPASAGRAPMVCAVATRNSPHNSALAPPNSKFAVSGSSALKPI
jgi:hypothetical protein